MKKEKKVPKQLRLSDLIAKVLNGSLRNDPTGGFLWISAVSLINIKLSPLEFSVVEFRYNIERDYQDSSVAYTAGVLNITKAKVRALEAKAIKRLCEPDCFGYFVKNFGSKRMLIEQIREIDLEVCSIRKDGNFLAFELSESELSHILESLDMIAMILRKHVASHHETQSITIVDLGLSKRAANALTWNKLDSIEKLCGTTERKLKLLTRVGPAVQKEIKAALSKHGLSLAS